MAMRRAVGSLIGRDDLAEGLGYTLKRRFLGKPLINEQLTEQRLSKPLALGVLSSDGISSAAYGSEEILIELVQAFGYAAAFSILLPMTLVVLFGIVLVVLLYREVVSVYTRAGGSYVGGTGQLRSQGGPGGCCRADDRLHRDGCSADCGRQRGDPVRLPGAGQTPGRDDNPAAHIGDRDPDHVLRKPARNQGGWPLVRVAHLPVLRLSGSHDRGRAGQGDLFRTAPRANNGRTLLQRLPSPA